MVYCTLSVLYEMSPLSHVSSITVVTENVGVAGFLCDKTAILGDAHSKEYNILEPGSVSKTLEINYSSIF